MNTFLVTSSINTLQSYGVYTPKDRLEQTLETAYSIRKYAKPSRIILLETTELSDEQIRPLVGVIDIVYNFSEHKFIRRIEDFYGDKYHYIKTPCEFYMLAHILSKKFMKRYISANRRWDMMYKLSGRYCLTPKFTELEEQYTGMTFGRRNPVVNYYSSETGQSISPNYNNKYSYPTRFFSFTYDESPLLCFCFKKMLKYTLDIHKKGLFTDMEHVMAQFINGPKEVDELGICGKFATTGEEIYE